MSKVYPRGNAEVRANLTPMIDITFLLIVFFVLVSQIVEVENVEMNLPEPVDPMTERPGDEPRAVINVIPGPGGQARGYRLSGRTYQPGAKGADDVTTALVAMYRANPVLSVNLRADRATQFEWIEPVIQSVSTAAARAGVRGADGTGAVDAVPRLNLVVIREE
jgi:biopolymer transport protein ExbD